jgi:predicted MPP superfamily phosphohydrolase
MLYLTLYFLLTDLVHWFNHLFHFLPETMTPLVFHRIQVISGYALTFLLLLVGYVHFTHPVVVEKNIVIHKSGGKYRDLKVVACSDWHLGVAVDKARLKQYVRLINDQKPDLILIAGDMIDNNARPLNEEKMDEEIRQLQAPLGVYFCLGNHEYLSGIETSLQFLQKTGMTVLIDSSVAVNDSFWIIGRNDLQAKKRLSLKQLVAQTNPGQPLFLLDHEPYHLEEAEQNGIDLQLSGHTHNGQMWPLNHIVNRLFELGHGYKQKGNTHIYVSSGLALWGPPFRIGTQSELVIFNIHFED